MQGSIRRVITCRVCGSDNWLEVMSFGSMPLANGFLDPSEHHAEPTYPLEVIVCRTCWLMSVRHVVNPEVLFSQYVYVTSDSQLMTNHMQHIVDLCAERADLAAGELVVEMGSNIGTQLGMFRRTGVRVVGVDPARNLASIANDNGIPTVPAFFNADAGEQVARDHGLAKVVLGRQCFAHIDDIHGVLDGVTAVLAHDGIFVIEVPYLLDLLDENQFDTIFHEHLSYFSVGTLQRLFALHGLSIIDVERANVHGGSIVVVSTPANSAAGKQQPAVAELLSLEQRGGIKTENRYLEFAVNAERVITAVGSLVRDLAASGKKIAAYGAPSKGCALMMACDLSPAEVTYCIDTTSYKQNTLMPGTHIPVRSRDAAASDPDTPDYYLLLAWNYADEIIRNEHQFLERGGSFIVPIPEPRIVSAARDMAAAGA